MHDSNLSVEQVYNPVENLPAVALFPQVEDARDKLIGQASLVGRVTNADENQRAFQVQQLLVTFDKFLDEARQFAKKPAWDRCTAIDGLARSLREPIRDEITRLSRMIGNYQAQEETRIEAEKKAAREDLDRLEREKNAALAAAPTLDAQDAVREQFSLQAASLPMPVALQKPKGQSLKYTWEISIVDPAAFVCAHLELADVGIKRREVTAILDTGRSLVGIKAERVPLGGARALKGARI